MGSYRIQSRNAKTGACHLLAFIPDDERAVLLWQSFRAAVETPRGRKVVELVDVATGHVVRA